MRSESSYRGKNLFEGIDVHKKRRVVSVRSYGLELKTFSMSPSEIRNKQLTK
jgi:hypothetical protein